LRQFSSMTTALRKLDGTLKTQFTAPVDNTAFYLRAKSCAGIFIYDEEDLFIFTHGGLNLIISHSPYD